MIMTCKGNINFYFLSNSDDNSKFGNDVLLLDERSLLQNVDNLRVDYFANLFAVIVVEMSPLVVGDLIVFQERYCNR